MVAELTAIRDQIDKSINAMVIEASGSFDGRVKSRWTAYLCSGREGIYIGLASMRSDSLAARSD